MSVLCSGWLLNRLHSYSSVSIMRGAPSSTVSASTRHDISSTPSMSTGFGDTLSSLATMSAHASTSPLEFVCGAIVRRVHSRKKL